jgi:hypothetical protein
MASFNSHAGLFSSEPAHTRNSSQSGSFPVELRRRLIVGKKISPAQRMPLFQWAVRSSFDTIVFPLRDRSMWNWLEASGAVTQLIEQNGITIEAGGWELSLLLPRSLFLCNTGLFRMDYGKRTPRYNFCPTNPKTIEIIKKNAAKMFGWAAGKMSAVSRKTASPRAAAGDAPSLVFHLWPDFRHEKTWCSCPACRAFSPAEQNRIAVNSAASALAEIFPQAKLSYFDFEHEASGIRPRENVFGVKQLQKL